MKKIFTSLLILLSAIISLCQTNNLNYYLQDATETGNSVIHIQASKQTADGGTLIVTQGIYKGAISPTNYGFAVAKYDNLGNKLWNKYIYGLDNQNTNVRKILELADGSFILGGNISANGGFIIKTNALGDFQFMKRYGGAFYDISFDSSDNGFIIASGGSSTKFSGNLAGYIIKTDGAGNILWNLKANYTSNNDHYFSIKRLTDGNYLAVGGYITTPSAIYANGLVAKYSATGALLWSKSYENTGLLNAFLDFKELPNHSILIAGAQGEYAPIGPWKSAVMLTEIDANGNLVWAKTYTSGFDAFFEFSAYQNSVHPFFSFSDNAIYAVGTIGKEGNSQGKPSAIKITETGNLLWTRLFKLPEYSSQLESYIGIDRATSVEVHGNRLSFNSTSSFFAMDTSILSSTCYIKDSSLISATTSPIVTTILPILTDTSSTTYPLILSTSSAIDLVKNDACDLSNAVKNLLISNKNIMIYPNPTSDVVTIKVTDFSHAVVYTISDITGRKLLSGKLLNESSTIDLGTLANGVYLFQLEKSNQSFKIIKI